MTETNAPDRQRRSSVGRSIRAVGWLIATPFVWLGFGRLQSELAQIRHTVSALRAPPQSDDRFTMNQDASFDLRASALLHGMSEREIEDRLRARRRQTAFQAYAALAVAVVSFALWLRAALLTPTTAGRLLVAIEFIPFCVLCLLLGFYQALLNHQIRVRRLVGWREYVQTTAGLWPT